MKVSPTANYTIRVLRQEWEELPETAALYAGIFAVALNHVVDISFVPDVSAVAPPWNYRLVPADLDAVETVEQARIGTALLSSYVVTPNNAHTGSEERFTWPSDDGPATSGVVFYVTTEEFARYTADLDRLTKIAGGLHSPVRVSQLRDHDAVDFLEHRVVASALLRPRDAMMLGRQTT